MATEPGWLRAWADASAVLLLLEVCFALLIVTALVFLLAFGARWLRLHVAPVLNAATPRARQALRMADASTERVVRGVAEVYGIRQAVEAGLRALLRGTAVDVLAQTAPATPPPAAASDEPPILPVEVVDAATPPVPASATPERWQQPEPPRPVASPRAPDEPREPRPPASGRDTKDTSGMSAHAG
ncbi:MAG TPA: hypothetical protein VGR57_19180 [Ktedonobacterales bacterium]|nr:hypothetical protein [Ktedonobacterales bacterium]